MAETVIDAILAFLGARLDEAQQEAEAMEHDRDWDDDWRSCLTARIGTSADKGYGEADCTCSLAERRAQALRVVAAHRAIVADCVAKMRYPANRPMYSLVMRTLENLAGIWSDHPDSVTRPPPPEPMSR